MTVVYIIGAFLFACLTVYGVMLWLAPTGYETDEGFFYGEEGDQ